MHFNCEEKGDEICKKWAYLKSVLSTVTQKEENLPIFPHVEIPIYNV